MFNLLEDNKDIENFIKHVSNKIVKLRTNKKLDPEILTALQKLYTETVDPWMVKYYLHNIEVDKNIEQQIHDGLYKLMGFIDKIENGNI